VDSGSHGSARAGRIVALPYVEQNPYQRLFYEALSVEGFELVDDASLAFKNRWLWDARARVAFIHFHWPQGYWTRWNDGPQRSLLSWVKVGLFAIRLFCARLLGYRIVWTIHEVRPHEPTFRALDRLGAAILARQAHLLLAHDARTVHQARDELRISEDCIQRIPHGPYPPAGIGSRSAGYVRDSLGIDSAELVFLSFGHIRRYKGIGVLLEAFALHRCPDSRLVIAGMPMDDESVAAIEKAAAGDPRIVSLVEYVPENAVAGLFEASDVSVLARGDGGTSGALVLSLSYGKPVIAADLPHYREIAGDGSAGWFFTPGSVQSLASALDAARDDQHRRRAAEAARRATKGIPSWTAVAEQTGRALRRIAK
jgi:beta-1,4-mannosyltransferase